MTERLIREFLDSLEREEAKLLAWGVVDGAFTEEEITERAEAFVEGHEDGEEVDPSELIAELIRRHLIIDLPLDAGRVYRSRAAEAIRLFVRLRQMFKFAEWRTGPTLVSDFRFSLRPRVYPRRDVPIVAAEAAWDAAGVLKPARRAALSALLDRPNFLLAGFQVRAAERVLRDLDGPWTRGMIVTVGTGSGKTLAFYLPALAHIATLIAPSSEWTKAIAMYPRNELLKDQFSDTYREARRLDGLLEAQGRRKLTIGAYFGPTPKRADEREVVKAKWEPTPGGYVCPFLRCPNCAGDMVWRKDQIARGHEQLDCPGCGSIVSGEVVYLTRQRMQEKPPDVLFTTTEMLNRVMGHAAARHVFGVGAQNPPQIMLLDEVHTYVGTHGAQVAYLLRRWRKAAGGRVQFTGLSATLRNAGEFFAQLTGLPTHAVEEVGPTQAEMEREGMEYMLVLRGDPVSKTSLVSTSIQTAMLLRRVLDPRSAPGGPAHEGIFGRKVFAFTDDLDVTNRLYHNLLDAEGLNHRGLPRAGREPLAALRSRGRPDNARRLRTGQSWYLCEEIGHPQGLVAPLTIGRTSSQDTGVDREADVIVATASLEVGYNDPDVGAVLQHKAPRDAASFVQRKGRAGRLRRTRPWTVVVLSDYGRDRLAYQGYEALFDPVLPPRILPTANRYVLRIQAVFAFIDWLALQLSSAPRGSVYMDLAGPASWKTAIERQDAEASIVRRLLEGDRSLNTILERYMGQALGLDPESVAAVMWEPPRSLMLHVLPTLLRRLESGWRRVKLRTGESARDYVVENSPLPDFVPPSLFSDLNLPEVAVVSSVWPNGGSPRQDSLPIHQALRTLVPGKVTRRFAVRHATASHWIPLPSLEPASTHQQIAVEEVCAEFEELGVFQARSKDGVVDVRCIRPWVMQPSLVPFQINPTSNAWPEWSSQIIPDGQGETLDLPSGSHWAPHVPEVRVHAHAFHSSVEIRRFALGARASISFRRSQSHAFNAEVTYIGRESGQRAAIGSTAHADGIRFLVALPGEDIVRADDPNQAKVRAYRTAYFRHRVLTDSDLSLYANAFQREWLYQVYLSALTAWALSDSPSLQQANAALLPVIRVAGEKVLRVIFEALAVDGDEEESGDDGSEDRQGRLRDEVIALLDEPEVTKRLHQLAKVLWEAPDPEWHAWASQRYLATLGGAMLNACQQLYPEAGSDDLLLDVDAGPRPPGLPSLAPGIAELWVTESAIGGGGVVEEISRRYAEDPRRFFRLVENALGPSDMEVTDSEVTRVLGLAEVDEYLQRALDSVRHAPRHDDLQAAIERLKAILEARGVLVNHPVMSAVYARITRPGSSPSTDRLLLDLIRRWHAYEERLGIEVDARVFAYLESERPEVASALATIDPEAATDRVFRFHAVYGLLWPRGNMVRSLALASYNPFATLAPTDRELVLDRVVQFASTISLSDADWRAKVSHALHTRGSARLTALHAELAALRAALLRLAADPLEVDYLHAYPRVDRVVRGADGFTVDLSLAEAVQ